MGNDLTYNPIEQMPWISCKSSLNGELLFKLPSNGLNKSTDACQFTNSQFRQRTCFRIVSPQRSMNINTSLLPKSFPQRFRTIPFISKNQPWVIFSHKFLNTCNIMDIRNYKRAYYPNPANFQMKLISKKCLSKPFPIRGQSLKQLCVLSSNKFTHFYRHTINYLKPLLFLCLQVFKKSFLNFPKTCRLPDKVTAVRHLWKKVKPMLFKVSINTFIFVKSFEFTNYFHSNHFAVSELGLKTPFPQFTYWKIPFAKIVNHSKNGYNKIYQFHQSPPFYEYNFIYPKYIHNILKEDFFYLIKVAHGVNN